jgi:hypothetical protein
MAMALRRLLSARIRSSAGRSARTTRCGRLRWPALSGARFGSFSEPSSGPDPIDSQIRQAAVECDAESPRDTWQPRYEADGEDGDSARDSNDFDRSIRESWGEVKQRDGLEAVPAIPFRLRPRPEPLPRLGGFALPQERACPLPTYPATRSRSVRRRSGASHLISFKAIESGWGAGVAPIGARAACNESRRDRGAVPSDSCDGGVIHTYAGGLDDSRFSFRRF